MEPLRRARHLVRLVLAWFAFALGASVASPLVHPQPIELICSAGGLLKAVVLSDDGATDLGATHLDCPLCLMASAPPPPLFVAPPPPPLPALAWQALPGLPLPQAAALPWHARAPPASS